MSEAKFKVGDSVYYIDKETEFTPKNNQKYEVSGTKIVDSCQYILLEKFSNYLWFQSWKFLAGSDAEQTHWLGAVVRLKREQIGKIELINPSGHPITNLETALFFVTRCTDIPGEMSWLELDGVRGSSQTGLFDLYRNGPGPRAAAEPNKIADLKPSHRENDTRDAPSKGQKIYPTRSVSLPAFEIPDAGQYPNSVSQAGAHGWGDGAWFFSSDYHGGGSGGHSAIRPSPARPENGAPADATAGVGVGPGGPVCPAKTPPQSLQGACAGDGGSGAGGDTPLQDWETLKPYKVSEIKLDGVTYVQKNPAELDQDISELRKGGPYPDGNPKTRYGMAKPSIGAIPAVALYELGKVMEVGRAKYGHYNWREHEVTASVYFEAAMRHLWAWWDGQDHDPDYQTRIKMTSEAMSKLENAITSAQKGMSSAKDPWLQATMIGGLQSQLKDLQSELDSIKPTDHRAHAMACLAIMLDAADRGKLNDDRGFAGGLPGFLVKEQK